jgi:hypothetical protein
MLRGHSAERGRSHSKRKVATGVRRCLMLASWPGCVPAIHVFSAMRAPKVMDAATTAGMTGKQNGLAARASFAIRWFAPVEARLPAATV